MVKKPEDSPLIQKIEALEKQLQDRQRAEKILLEKQKRYERLVNTIPCALYDYVRWPDGRSRFIYISSQCKNIFELEAETIMNNEYLLWNMVVPEDLECLKQQDQAANQALEMFQSEVRIIPESGRRKWIQLTSMPSSEKFDSQDIWSGVILDVTHKKEAEEERDRLLSELQQALAEVKTLKGIIPICSYCKKVRDDKGFWNQVEAYVAKHSHAEWSHGICPDCARIHFPEFDLHSRD